MLGANPNPHHKQEGRYGETQTGAECRGEKGH